MKHRTIFFTAVTTLALLLVSFTTHKNNAKPNDKFIVVLDAGHGGHDPGNLGNGFKEKDIALKIVLKVGELLKNNKDIEVIYTRTKDVFVPLKKRGEIANKAKADLFVSVHCNAHGSKAHGTETFVLGLHANKQNFEVAKKENQVIYLEENYESTYAGYDINSPESVIGLTIMQEEFLDQSIMLAKAIQDNFDKKLKRVNRGVKQAGFIVLHQTYMPSVLVEAGFLSYRPEGEYLNSNKGQQQVAKAITDAILQYKKNIETNVGLDTSFETVNNLPQDQENNNQTETQTETNTNLGNGSEAEHHDTIKNTEQVTFRVQLAASTKKIPLKPENFKGLTNLSSETYNRFYRYMYGNTTNYKEALKLKEQAKAKGFTSCFIVAYKNGKRVPVTTQMQTTSN